MCSPQPNLPQKNISPAGSLHQSPNPLFPFTTPPFLEQTLFVSTTLKMEVASCTKTFPHKVPYQTRHQSSSPMLPNVNSFLLTPALCSHVQRTAGHCHCIIIFGDVEHAVRHVYTQWQSFLWKASPSVPIFLLIKLHSSSSNNICDGCMRGTSARRSPGLHACRRPFQSHFSDSGTHLNIPTCKQQYQKWFFVWLKDLPIRNLNLMLKQSWHAILTLNNIPLGNASPEEGNNNLNKPTV